MEKKLEKLQKETSVLFEKYQEALTHEKESPEAVNVVINAKRDFESKSMEYGELLRKMEEEKKDES